ncbi:hypothetical protein [Streptococcus pneumoniae]|uniref:hypothetical protein n=1 Tax=Streptococcus pneumoniae TaxID=1313 RepID=UPI0015D98D6E|nr:hypothetical protein [Streptococcus pneumoniae]
MTHSLFRYLILFENLFKLRQRRLYRMYVTDFVSLITTSKQCFEQPTASFELTASDVSTTSKQYFEQPATSLPSLLFDFH